MFSLNRYLSSRITSILVKTPITPNQVTCIAFVFALLAGFCLSKGTHRMMLFGALWLHISFLLDNCDGELARAKSMVTDFGRKLDLFTDFLVDCCLWFGLALGAQAVTGQSIWIVLSVFCCIGSALNEGMVIWERRKGCCTSIHSEQKFSDHQPKTIFQKVIAAISHNGDIILLVWVMASIGSPSIFLISSTTYIYALIILRLFTHWKTLLS